MPKPKSTPKTEEVAKRRANVSGVNLLLGSLISVTVDLVSARPTDKSDFTSLCPDCDEPHALSQRSFCKETESIVETEDVIKGRIIDKKAYPVTPEQYEAVKANTITDPKAPISVRVFPAEDVEAVTRPTGNPYYLRPVKATEKAYAVFAEVVADAKTAFVVEAVFRGSQKVYRIENWNGTLLLQELIRPNEFAAAERFETAFTKAEVKTMKQLMSEQLEEFEATEFRFQGAERAAALDADLLSAPAKKSKKVAAAKPKAKPEDDLMAALQASLDANKKKAKKPKKNAA